MTADRVLQTLLIASKGLRPAARSRALFRVLTALTLTVALHGWTSDVGAKAAGESATGSPTATFAFPIQQPARQAAGVSSIASKQMLDAMLVGEVSQRL